MSLLSAHLEQISYSCQGIDALRFPPPKIFTNALLSNHDITSLIRDTEAHERALFSVPAPSPPQDAPTSAVVVPPPDEAADANRRRRQTVFSVASGEVTAAPTGSASHPRRRTAVAAVLGGEMHEQLRADRKGELDVDVLLRGAEKLCGVYELPGARERIAALRSRFRAGTNTVAYYEAKVSDQAAQLAAMNKLWIDDVDGDKQPEDEIESWTEDDLRREEQEAREMEVKKKELQERLRAMDKDLGGLMNM
ncbi:hypothetical protein L249_0158 [Ophiocordyceps polyrhachis-furcata BCC 54312]|uniref:DASH complex subunit SPC34 n=1 Tax=Ophiocordyceps polyrhachis-furcata BCC 54312 TaxID=1330021 RepID=A0A367LCR0_9HYPO|nr:hypothetical protein L249_0158 [Ophiocordyceps polyrhachis-furcata BCC 54312]